MGTWGKNALQQGVRKAVCAFRMNACICIGCAPCQADLPVWNYFDRKNTKLLFDEWPKFGVFVTLPSETAAFVCHAVPAKRTQT